jgi:23S rRNA (adenine2503-C2)-methyltransferase
MATPRPALSGLPPDELSETLKPLPSFRARQIFKWIAAGVSRFDDMSNLPLDLREELGRRFRFTPAPRPPGWKTPTAR